MMIQLDPPAIPWLNWRGKVVAEIIERRMRKVVLMITNMSWHYSTWSTISWLRFISNGND
jgi:hypothetical protein